MNSIIELIEYLKSIDAPVSGLLQHGISATVVENRLAEKGLLPTEDVVAIYTTCNGTAMNGDYLGYQYLFPGFIMISLDTAIDLYDEECLIYKSWGIEYMPIFWNGNRDYLLIDCINHGKGVYYFSPDEFRFEGRLGKIYDSVNLIFKTVLACFKAEGYKLGNSIEGIAYDAKIVNELSKRLNPSSEYWNFS